VTLRTGGRAREDEMPDFCCNESVVVAQLGILRSIWNYFILLILAQFYKLPVEYPQLHQLSFTKI
jgi:hypothetical protein